MGESKTVVAPHHLQRQSDVLPKSRLGHKYYLHPNAQSLALFNHPIGPVLSPTD
jgi:hypothetical protein